MSTATTPVPISQQTPLLDVTTTKRPSKGPNKEGLNPLTTYFLGAFSACTAESVVYPCDIVKTRLQIMPGRSNMFATASTIVSTEGLSGIYMGFNAACFRHLIYSGGRYFAYEMLREHIFKRNNDGTFPLYKSALAAMSAGAIGQFAASPTDLIKVQMQTEGFRALKGESQLYLGTTDCFKQMYRKLGAIGMWKGWFPNVQRAAFVQLGDLCAYDVSKQNILYYTSLNDNFLCHGCASIIAGLVATLMSTPSDVLKTRIMSNPDKYKSTMDCLIKTIHNDGIFAIYRGFWPIWARMGPKAMVFYLAFEQGRNLLGLSSW